MLEYLLEKIDRRKISKVKNPILQKMLKQHSKKATEFAFLGKNKKDPNHTDHEQHHEYIKSDRKSSWKRGEDPYKRTHINRCTYDEYSRYSVYGDAYAAW